MSNTALTPSPTYGRKTFRKIFVSGLTAYGWIFVLIGLFLTQRLAAHTPHLVETIHISTVRENIVGVMNFWNSTVPFSVTETILFVAVLAAILFALRSLKEGTTLSYLSRSYYRKLLPTTGWILAGAYVVYMAVHGINYSREPVAEHFNFHTAAVSTATASELVLVGEWLIEETNTLRETRNENEEGEFMPHTPLRSLLGEGVKGYEEASRNYPTLKKRSPKVKPVQSSRYWSYFNTTGMYFPLLSEININTHAPAHEVLETVLHELAHSKGYAREDEANFVAFIAGVHHPDSDYRYSVFLQNTKRVLNRLKIEDETAYENLSQQLSEEVLLDLQASRDYWQRYKTIVGTATTKMNNVFLKTNTQTEGIASYGRVVDLIASWHLSRMEEENDSVILAGQ